MTETPTRPVLLVEDDPNDVLFLQRALTRIHSPLPLLVIDDGLAAWEYLSGTGATHRPNLPSLILLDLKLPKLSGIEILTKLKQDPRLRGIPVIVMSSSNAQGDVDAVYALGADFYILKSLDSEVTEEQARAIHAHWTAVCDHPDVPGADPTLAKLRKLAERPTRT